MEQRPEGKNEKPNTGHERYGYDRFTAGIQPFAQLTAASIWEGHDFRAHTKLAVQSLSNSMTRSVCGEYGV